MSDDDPAAVELDELIAGTQVCRCPAFLVMDWFAADGQVVGTRILNEAAVAGNRPARDAHRFVQAQAVRWTIACPMCGRVFVTGELDYA